MEEESGMPADEVPVMVYTEPEEDIEAEDDADHPWRSYVKNGLDLLETDFPDRPWTVNGLIPSSSLTILGGTPKVGKSFFSLGLAVSVALGQEFLGEFEVTQGKVLYMALEGSDEEISDNLKVMVDGKPAALKENLHTIATDIPRWDKGGNAIVASWVVDNIKDAKLIIIDTHQRFRPAKSMGGGYNNDYNSLLGLSKIVKKTGVPIIVVHHTTKPTTNKAWDMTFSGSLGLTAVCDSLMVLKRMSKTVANLHIRGRRMAENKYRLEFDGSSLRWNFVPKGDGDDDDEDGLDIISVGEIKILEVFMTEPEGTLLPAKEIIARSGLPDTTAKRHIRTLIQKNQLVRAQKGWYRFNKDQQP